MKNHLLQARCWWLTPIIPATWKDDIRRIHVSRPVQAKSSQDSISTNGCCSRRLAVPGQLGQKKLARPQLNRQKLGRMAPAYHPNDSKKHKIGDSCSGLPGHKGRFYLQINQRKKG
jgi:hypothetical protein